MKSMDGMKERLRFAMQLREVSITELSLDLQVSKASVSEWVSSGKISFDHLAALSVRLNLSLHWLLTGMGEMGLHGTVNPTRTEKHIIEKLRAAGGERALAVSHQFFAMMMKEQLGDEPIQQVMYQKILDDLSCPLCVIDEGGLVCDANIALLKLLGLATSEARRFVGSNLISWLPPEAIDSSLGFLQRIRANTGRADWFHGALRSAAPQKGFVDVSALVKMREFSGKSYFDCLVFPD